MGSNVLVVLTLLFVAGSPAAAPAPLADDPACVQRRVGDLCTTRERTGGICAVARCGDDGRPCLQCAAAATNTNDESSAQTVLLIIGTVVSLGGLVFVWRLRKHWK